MRPLVSLSSVTYLWAWIQTYSYYELADSLAGIDLTSDVSCRSCALGERDFITGLVVSGRAYLGL